MTAATDRCHRRRRPLPLPSTSSRVCGSSANTLLQDRHRRLLHRSLHSGSLEGSWLRCSREQPRERKRERRASSLSPSIAIAAAAVPLRLCGAAVHRCTRGAAVRRTASPAAAAPAAASTTATTTSPAALHRAGGDAGRRPAAGALSQSSVAGSRTRWAKSPRSKSPIPRSSGEALAESSEGAAGRGERGGGEVRHTHW